MSSPTSLLLGEYARKLDERFRLSVPSELAEPLWGQDARCILAKERSGCLSVWNQTQWDERMQPAVAWVQSKLQAGKLDGRVAEVQQLGRLLSTRHRAIDITGRSRLLIPEGFREFLDVEAGGEVMIIGAAVCVEIWKPQRLVRYLQRRVPRFRRLLERLSD